MRMLMVMQPTDQQIGYLLKRAQNELRNALERGMAGTDLTMSRYAALASLDEAESLSNAELARRCFVSPQTMIRVLRDLERDGYVTRDANPDSGREVLTALTDRGRTLLQDGHAISTDVHLRLLDGIDVDQDATLRTLLRRLADNLTA
ncbi:MarR family transcriptional regulator [soil metagenome]